MLPVKAFLVYYFIFLSLPRPFLLTIAPSCGILYLSQIKDEHMEFYTLASSSSGNCSVVLAGKMCLLIDAGISCRRIEQSLKTIGLTPAAVTAALITHEHSDHTKGLATLLKKYHFPVYASTGTAAALAESLGTSAPIVSFSCGEELSFPLCRVKSFPLSHDAADPTGYRIDTADGSLGILTDTGVITDGAEATLPGVDTLLLEANHDVERLKAGPYPYPLKKRILSRLGHLSNETAAAFALRMVRAGTTDILLAHLSAENNTPALAEYAVARALQERGESVRLCVAPRDTISEVHLCRKSHSYVSEN